MNVRKVSKDKFRLIGMEGRGMAEEGFKWVPLIWKKVMPRIEEIKSLEKLDEKGESKGIWGAMTDIKQMYQPWEKEGRYLVGKEVHMNVEPKDDWICWDIPGFKYLVVTLNQEDYGTVLKEMLKVYMPKHQYKLVGAIQEYYSTSHDEGELDLCFPIERL